MDSKAKQAGPTGRDDSTAPGRLASGTGHAPGAVIRRAPPSLGSDASIHVSRFSWAAVYLPGALAAGAQGRVNKTATNSFPDLLEYYSWTTRFLLVLGARTPWQ